MVSDSRISQNIAINQATYAKIETKRILAVFLQVYTCRVKPAALLKKPKGTRELNQAALSNSH